MIDWIFKLFEIPKNLHGEPWSLVFERQAPTWVWFVALIFIVLIPVVSYTNSKGSPRARAVLTTLRMFVLLFITIMVMKPAMEWPQEKTEPDIVQILVDRSSSMLVRDGVDASKNPVSRDEVLKNTLQSGVWDTIAKEHTLEWVCVDGTTRVVANPSSITEPVGNKTLLCSAIQESVQKNLGRPLSSIILISDGRSQDTIKNATLQHIQSLKIPIHTIPLGDPNGKNDRAVTDVEAPQTAFLNDQIPIQAQISTRLPNQVVKVLLREKETLRIIDEQILETGSDGRTHATLMGLGKTPGGVTWEVVVVGERDNDPTNDTQRVDIEFIDRSIRVLYLDGWPRWEFRYIKNILLREKGIESSIMLLSADRDFAQEGTTPISRLPNTEKEFSGFDVIILGDVPAGFLSVSQQKAIQETIAKRGAGLLWIAGERSTPSSWRGSPMEELFPFRGSLDLARIDRPVYMQPTPAAERLGLLRLVNQQNSESSWPAELSPGGESWGRLEWVQQIDTRNLKPTAEVLANAVYETGDPSTNSETHQPPPLVLTMRYGAGQTTYVATDETWRWRHGRGETLPERFWIQLIRHLARSCLRNNIGVALTVDPPRVSTNQPTRITVELSGQSAAGDVVVEAQKEGGTTIDIPLKPEGGDRFSSAWIAPNDGGGNWKLKIRNPSTVESPAANLVVVQEDAERTDTSPNHDFLQKLSAASGGRVFSATDIQGLEKLIPRRTQTTRQPIQLPLWNQWIFYLFFVLVITAEWVGRRMMKML